MPSLLPDITVTKQAIERLVTSLSDDPHERAEIAATAAWLFISLDQGDAAADAALLRRVHSHTGDRDR